MAFCPFCKKRKLKIVQQYHFYIIVLFWASFLSILAGVGYHWPFLWTEFDLYTTGESKYQFYFAFFLFLSLNAAFYYLGIIFFFLAFALFSTLTQSDK
jgi:hypothetical protein